MISVTEAAVQLGVKPRWIRRMCETGQLKAIKKSGVWDIDPRSLRALAAKERKPGNPWKKKRDRKPGRPRK